MDTKSHTRIISFDPGVSTGICFLEDGNFRWGMVAIPAMFASDSFFRGLVIICKPTCIVVEELPPGGFPSKDQRYVFESIVRWYGIAGYDVHRILPGYWKSLIEKDNVNTNPHINDAKDMGRWFYQKQARGLG
jgi:hypothetical protein